MKNSHIILFMVLVGLVVIYKNLVKRKEGFSMNDTYSYIDESSYSGNDISWDGIVNPEVTVDDKGISDPVIFQGHQLPLSYETKVSTPIPEANEMVLLANYKFSPECCKYNSSPYSSDAGCACFTGNKKWY